MEAFNCFNFTKQPYASNAFMDMPFLTSMPQIGMECPFRLGLILLSTSGWLHPFLSNSFKWNSPQLKYWLADHPSPELRLLLVLDTRWCLWETWQLIKKICHWLFKNNPEGPVAKNPPCSAEDMVRSLEQKIPHAAEQLRPWAATAEPVLWGPRATTAEPACTQSLRLATSSSPGSPTRE